jgi:hypothetical protein
MTSLDLLVILALGSMAAWPFLVNSLVGLASRLQPRPATPAAPAAEGGSIVEEWRQAWAFTLMRLIDDIETGDSHFEDLVLARKLTRDLLWEVIGGDGPAPSKGK